MVKMPSCKKIGAFVLCLGMTTAAFIFYVALVAALWYAFYAFGSIFIGGLIYHNIISECSRTTAVLKGGTLNDYIVKDSIDIVLG